MTVVTYRGVITRGEPHKPLTRGRKRDVGRNAAGRITTRHKGGGHKRLYRDIDFFYDKKNIPAKIESIEYDPNRSGFIALICYADGERRYVLAPRSLKLGDKVETREKGEVRVGNRMALSHLPVGTFVYNVELMPGGGAKFVRSAGSYAEVLSTDGGYTTLKMPSGEIRRVSERSYASVGAVSNEEHMLVSIGKAGRSRWLGIRPTVRGTAMNPVDHPHGGGEGRQGRGRRRNVSAWGKITGGVRTRRKKKRSNSMIVARRGGVKRR